MLWLLVVWFIGANVRPENLVLKMPSLNRLSATRIDQPITRALSKANVDRQIAVALVSFHRDVIERYQQHGAERERHPWRERVEHDLIVVEEDVSAR